MIRDGDELLGLLALRPGQLFLELRNQVPLLLDLLLGVLGILQKRGGQLAELIGHRSHQLQRVLLEFVAGETHAHTELSRVLEEAVGPGRPAPIRPGGVRRGWEVAAVDRGTTRCVSNEGTIAKELADHDAYFHVDAAQGFGKEIPALRQKRIDLISISGHKIYGPKGIGALIARRRGYKKAPLNPLMYGGGQERGLRPGTMPVPLAVGLGVASEMAAKNYADRATKCSKTRDEALEVLSELRPVIHGDPDYIAPHVLNVSIPGVDAEAAMVALKGVAAVSNGSACTSHSYTPSHVLAAMGLNEDEISTSLRISWCHLTSDVDWIAIRDSLMALRR